MSSLAEQLTPGTLVDSFEIVETIHLGAANHVYRARAPDGVADIALKLPASATPSPLDADLAAEAALILSLDHANIARAVAVGTWQGRPFLALEFIPGYSLQELLRVAARRGRGIHLSDALFIVQSVADGLAYAHALRSDNGADLGIVHRDISPTNIVLRRDGAVKLIDFGIAKSAGQQRAPTAPGTLRGNLRYMSPEQCTHAKVDQRTDLFALCIVLFELTTGTRWIRERDDFEAIRAMLERELPRPSERRTGYPPRLEDIVMRGLARDPQERFLTAHALRAALAEFSLAAGLTPSQSSLAAALESLTAGPAPESILGGACAGSTLKLKR